jgi:hypothetical protein
MKLNSERNYFYTIIFVVIALCLSCPQFAIAEETKELVYEQDEKSSDVQEFKNGFYANLRILTYGIAQELANTSQNPKNNFLQRPQYIANMEIRPDIGFVNERFIEVSVKPRAKLDFQIWKEDGVRDGDTKRHDDWYINEWFVRLKPLGTLYFSYGRENLQWGPSFLLSPSNPFFKDNGRSNPYMEVQGMDFGRLVYIPHNLWTISLMVNTDEGRNMLSANDNFKETYALKIDYAGRGNYASLIVSQKDLRKTLGFFGGWTVSDALLLYGECSMQRGSDALYPKKDESPLGVSMSKIYEGERDVKPLVLIGSSYTLKDAGTFSLEYIYNDAGYTSEEADQYYDLRRKASVAFNMYGLAHLYGASVLYQTIAPGLRLLRKNYTMLQYNQTNIINKIDLTVRWTQNIDDGSAQFLGLLSYSLGDHWELFSSGVVNAGSGDTEFGSILRYQVMLGVKWVF